MTRYFVRKKTGAREDLRAGLAAGALATTVAAVAFYLVRLFLSREAMGPDDEAGGTELSADHAAGDGN